jgi:serine protease Do/serine protease DegQ
MLKDMKKNFRFLLPIAALATATATGFLVAQDKADEKAPEIVIKSDSRPIDRTGPAHPTSYAPMLEEARRSVVSVHTSEVVRYVQRSRSREQEMLRRFFGAPRQFDNDSENEGMQEREIPQGAGSGVIISPDGYILTNNHVVVNQRGEDTDKILVRLSDDTELEAELVGRDPKTDIAVIKVDGENLPSAKVADSDQVKVGDIVFAIGNPLNVGLTVTSGIISATGRSIGIYGRDGYEDFIQTDASVNRGNSGGALVDIEGRLIGINSAILSGSGGSIGIGFAIPSNLATNITEQLVGNGEVRRGLIGVAINDLTPEIAEAMNAKGTRGILIERVSEGYPAEKAGLQHGDIITHVAEQKVNDPNDLRLAISRVIPGETVGLKIVRDGQEMSFEVGVTDPNEVAGMDGEFIDGIAAKPLDDELRQSQGIPRDVSGIIVTDSSAQSPFSRYLPPGLVIMEINKRPVRTLEEAQNALRSRGNNLLYTYHEGRASYFALRLK